MLETRKREHFTTARVIHDSDPAVSDYLWINPNASHEFLSEEGAQSLANLANENGRDSGLDINNYPYFPVKVLTTSVIERV